MRASGVVILNGPALGQSLQTLLNWRGPFWHFRDTCLYSIPHPKISTVTPFSGLCMCISLSISPYWTILTCSMNIWTLNFMTWAYTFYFIYIYIYIVLHAVDALEIQLYKPNFCNWVSSIISQPVSQFVEFLGCTLMVIYYNPWGDSSLVLAPHVCLLLNCWETPRYSQIAPILTNIHKLHYQKTEKKTLLSVDRFIRHLRLHHITKREGGGFSLLSRQIIRTKLPKCCLPWHLDAVHACLLGICRMGGMWPHKSEGFMWGSCEGGNECTLKTQ